MAEPLAPIALQDLLSSEDGASWQVHQQIAGLDSQGPVVGRINARPDGPLLRVEGELQAAVSLRCDRCLQTYAQPLRARVSERLAIGGSDQDLAEALDFDADGFSEQLDPAGSFDPERWVYEQLSLQLPLVNRCGPDCPGPASWGTADPLPDPRWAALRSLDP
jgi:uncharacterized protein